MEPFELIAEVPVLITRITGKDTVSVIRDEIELYKGPDGSANRLDPEAAYGYRLPTDKAYRVEYYYDGKWYQQYSTGSCFRGDNHASH